MNEVILIESLSLREKLCTDEHTSILERVGNLITLPQEGFATTEQVAAFYKSPIKSIQTVVIRHRDELERDGYKVLTSKEFRDLHREGLKSKARLIAIFPRKAILRIGMLLAESEIAKQIRNYLLSSEEQSLALSNRQTLITMTEQLQEHAESIARNARQSSDNAEQLIHKANILKAMVQEIYLNRDEIKKNQKRIEKLELRFSVLGEAKEEFISERQIRILREIVKKKPETAIKVWHKFNKYFGVTRYRFLPSCRFEEALEWLNRY